MRGYRIITSTYKNIFRLEKKGFLGIYSYVCTFSCNKGQDLETQAMKELKTRIKPNTTVKEF